MTTIDRTTCTAHRHGNEWAYSKHGCRCPDGRAAWTHYSYNRRHGLNPPRLTDATPTATRLRILAALGWDWRAITAAAGWRSPKQVTDLALARQTTVTIRTAHRLAAMFAKLVAEPVPYGYGALRATNNAERAGWGLVDIEAVNQALAGANPTLSPLEQQATIHIGHARGMAITTNAARSIPAAVDTGRLFDMPIRRDPAARRPMFELIPMDERR